MKGMYGRPLILLVIVSLLWARFDSHKPLYAQESCNPILAQLEYSIQPNTCETIGDNSACYGSDSITSSFKVPRSWTLGQEVGIGDLQSFATQSPYGVGFLVLKNPGSDPVKVVAFGNTDVTQHDGQVLALHGTGKEYLCDRTPSGLIAQTAQHDTGYITVNGVRIKLGSTALITVDSIVLFDDAPRDNRKGGGNYFCSGFESDCGFGNCAPNQRLIYGLYCRENSYPYVGKGLYRVTVHGQGTVTAGATDYGVSNESFSLGSQEMTLPGSYTFWWPGLRPGSYGFEPVVIGREPNARVDHVTLEYLGEGTAPPEQATTDSDFMTVTNLDGNVEVSAGGTTVNIPVGYQVRIYFTTGVPVIQQPPVPATAVLESPVIRWFAFDNNGVAAINQSCDGTIAYGQSLTEEIRRAGRNCEFTFDGSEGDSIAIRMNSLAGNTLDPLLELVDPTGRIVATNDDTGDSRNSLITYDLQQGGTYTIRARSYNDASTGVFSIQLQGITPPPTPTPDPGAVAI